MNHTVRSLRRDVPNMACVIITWMSILMCNISKFVKYILFADDTNMFCADSNIGKLSDMCDILDKMSTWFAVNRLTLSVSKTN